MRTLAPPTGLVSLRKEMDRLFDHLWDMDLPELPALGEWSPNLDLSEGRESITVKAEVPGIDPKDIQITLREQVLTIKGEKRQEREEKDERYYRVERGYGSFARSVRLPAPVDAKKVSAIFRNGLLTIGLVKSTTGDGTTIPIKAE